MKLSFSTIIAAAFIATVSAQTNIGTFIAPADGDERGPCPAINTLANMGLINRNGQGVLTADLSLQLSNTYPVSVGFPDGVINGARRLGLTFLDSNGDERINIKKLGDHNRQEHDASFVREDFAFGNDAIDSSGLASDRLIDRLVGLNDIDFLTRGEVMEFQEARILESRKFTPDNEWNADGMGGMSAQAVLLIMFGRDPSLRTVDKAILESILREERLPIGYERGDDVIVDFTVAGSAAVALRAEFTASIEAAMEDKFFQVIANWVTSFFDSIFNVFQAGTPGTRVDDEDSTEPTKTDGKRLR